MATGCSYDPRLRQYAGGHLAYLCTAFGESVLNRGPAACAQTFKIRIGTIVKDAVLVYSLMH